LRGRIHRRRLKTSGLKVKNRLPRQPKAKKKNPPWQPTGRVRSRTEARLCSPTKVIKHLINECRCRGRAAGEAMMVLLFHVKGMEAKHMTWLKKSEPTEAWEIEDEEKIGDIELARQIREICNSVADSAEAVSVLYYGPSTETKKREIDRYERAKKRAEKNIEQISDELLRDTAIYQVLNFCMKAGDVETAERLFHQIQTARIAALVKSEHPMFRDS
jgi:pentatricopeptide repeat protein